MARIEKACYHPIFNPVNDCQYSVYILKHNDVTDYITIKIAMNKSIVSDLFIAHLSMFIINTPYDMAKAIPDKKILALQFSPLHLCNKLFIYTLYYHLILPVDAQIFACL